MGQYGMRENSEKQQRIETLARTLKLSGFASSDAQARKMAEEMLGVEDKVQKQYEEANKAPARPIAGYQSNIPKDPYFARPSGVQNMHPQTSELPKQPVPPSQEHKIEQAEAPQTEISLPDAVLQPVVQDVRAIDAHPILKSSMDLPLEKDEFPDDKSLNDLMHDASELEQANLEQPGEKTVPRPELELFEDKEKHEELDLVEEKEQKQAPLNPEPLKQQEPQPTEEKKKKISTSAEEEVDISEIFNFKNR
jgi:hypothetical protein